MLRHKKSNFGPLLPDIYAAMAFESMADGRQVVKLEVAEGVDAVSAVQFGVRASILEAVRQENMTVEGMAVVLDDYDIGSIRNEVTALKR